MTDMQKMLALMAAQSAGGLLNRWGGGQPQQQINPVALMQYQQEQQDREAEKARVAQQQEMLKSYFQPQPDPNAPTTLSGASPVGGAAAMSFFPEETGGDQSLLDPRLQPIVAMMEPEDQLSFVGEQLMAPAPTPQAPVRWDEKHGDEFVTYGLDPSGKPMEVARAPRYKQGDISIETNVGPTGIDYGDPEAGHAWVRRPDGSVKTDERGLPISAPYQGGSVYREEAAAAEAAAKAAELDKVATATKVWEESISDDRFIQDVDTALDIAQNSDWPTTGMGSLLSIIPGQPPHDLAQILKALEGKIAFDRLTRMRNQSKTGGALGAIAVKELELLAADYGALAQSQSKGQFVENMTRMRNDYLDVIHGPPTKVTTPEEASQLPSGTRILLPDGSRGIVP